MGTTNEEIDSRSTKEKREFHNDSGWDKDARNESRVSRNQQKRINREDSPRPNFLPDGSTTIGGILRQLIDEYKSQVAQKESEINTLNSKIQEFDSLLEQLEITHNE